MVDITPTGQNNVIVRRYDADLTGLAGQAVTLFASGFLAGDEPFFQTWVALEDGTTFPLDEIVSTREPNANIDVYTLNPNPASVVTQLNYSLRESDTVEIMAFNAAGQLIYRQAASQQSAGVHQLDIPVANWPAGTYQVFIRTSTDRVSAGLVVTK